MKKLVQFSWNIHRKCNFRCPYCWWHDKWNEFKPDVYQDLDKLVHVWKRIYDLYGKVHIDILGGEPSIYPQINELLLEITKYHEIVVTTNLSGCFDKLLDTASTEQKNNIFRIAATFHPLFADIDTFLAKAKKYDSKISNFGVVYLAYPAQIKQIDKYKNIFEKEHLEFSLLTFWGTYNGKKYPYSYTDEEKKIIDKYVARRGNEKFQMEPFNSKGKLCNAGHKYALVEPDGRVLSCGGAAINLKKNLFDPNFKLLEEPMACPSQTCPCNEWVELLVR